MGPGGLIPGNYSASQLSPDQRQWLFNYFGNQGQVPAGYGGQNVSGEMSNYNPGETAQQIVTQNSNDLGKQQQAQYQAAQGSAVQTLQGQKTNLSQQYSDLLKTVNGEYQPLINQATTQENNFLGARGLLSQQGAGGNQMSQALQGIYGQEASNAQALGQGSINDQNTLTQAIAQAQQGGAQFAANLPLQYGSLSMQAQALPSLIAQQQAQAAQYQTGANYLAIPNLGIYDLANRQLLPNSSGFGGASGGNAGGAPMITIP